MTDSPKHSPPLETSPEVEMPPGSSGAEPVAEPQPHPPQSSESEPGFWHGLWILLVRLVMLGAGVSLGWVLGVLIAQVFPSSNPKPPLQEVLMRSTSQTTRKLKQLPQWWQGNDRVLPASETEVTDEPPVPAEAPPRLTLSPELQEQVEADLALLETDLDALEDRLTELESSLGETPSTGPLETRLQGLQQLIAPLPDATEAAPTLAPPPGTAADSGAPSLYEAPAYSLVSNSIVLPSALLFEPGSSLLTPAGQQLLQTIVPDLRRYPQATLLVGSHTASDADPQAARKLSFQQAMAVRRYLDLQLGNNGVHWVTLGYGATRPRVVGDLPDLQQRNQRVEIGIVPQ
jgi:outer membrane protein OmpA-like peptidoglycan-associated protein